MDEGKYQVDNIGPVQGQIIGDHNTITQNFYGPRGASAHHAPPEHIWLVPYRRNPFFTGRDDILNRLHDYFKQSRTIAIEGLGGIGKTQIALEYAYRYQDTYSFVLWGNAENEVALTKDFVEFSRLLLLPQRNKRDEPAIVASVESWLTQHGNWLLILDNADDLTLVSRFIPSGDHGHILLTTRRAITNLIARSFTIEKMDEDEGVVFLLRRAGKLVSSNPVAFAQVSEEEYHVASEIVNEMDGLPLALDQAAAYIADASCSVTDYLEAYKRRGAGLLARLDEESQYPASVATTWSLSFEKVEKSDPIAADLLHVLAFLAADAIPEDMLVASAAKLGPRLQKLTDDPTLLNDACATLRRFSLVRRDTDHHLLSIHRLVQAVLRATMTGKTQQEWAERTVRAVNLAFPEVEFTTWPQCERYLPHARICATWIEQEQMTFPEAALLLLRIGWYLKERARYKEAESLVKQAVEISTPRLASDHVDIAQMLAVLAGIYDAQGRYAEAEPLSLRALTIYEQRLGPEHPYTARSLSNLASLYNAQGNYVRAEPLYLRALALREQVLGPEHPDTAGSLSNLAYCYVDQGRYVEAEPLMQRALAISEHVLGPHHPDTAANLNNLAELYCQQGKYAEAEPLYLRALAICEQQLGPDHPDTANSLDNLAGLYFQWGDYTKVAPLYQRALTISERQLGPDHPDTADCLDNLAALYCEQEKYMEAESLLKRALTIYERQLGPDHPDTASCLHNSARLYDRQGHFTKAEPLYLRALTIREQQLGHNHPHTLMTREKYSDLQQKLRLQAEAETRNTTSSQPS